MDAYKININGLDLKVHSINTIVVGSGAAGFNAADSLYNLGQKDLAIVTEGLSMGTSRNTGSDKQTYYKLTVSGDGTDSVHEMAKNLFNGGCMHGDIALVQAALSSRAFFKLVEIGIPFPHNRYGEYVGYKTDHDPRQRATSAGPLTSRYMTEKLEQQVLNKGIRIFDGFQVIGIITDAETKKDKSQINAVGLIALNLEELGEPHMGFTIFNCTNIIYATGGPAGIYSTSVYPESQIGASGIAFEAGIKGINLTESQYGIASTKFRWNLSGTYQQVLPRYISTNKDGTDEREFLNKYFETPGTMLDAIFLKGYQWPFDPRKIEGFGSSMIDILIYNETQVRGRKVYVDYTKNSSFGSVDGKLDFSMLGQEAFGYLKNSGALFGTPFERLKKMNEPAIELYKNNGINLEKEYLEIAVCAQHNNGGLMGNIWCESNVHHFFPVGEVNGTFGIYRPGGSALNSTQVDSLRAAQYIHANYGQEPLSKDEFINIASQKIGEKLELALEFLRRQSDTSNIVEVREATQVRMTEIGAHIRSLDRIEKGINECLEDLKNLRLRTKMSSAYELPYAFQNLDIFITQFVYLNAIKQYILAEGKSRGSYLIFDENGSSQVKGLSEEFKFTLDNGKLSKEVCEMELDIESYLCQAEWKAVRPIPEEDNWFENVWNAYRLGDIVK